MTNRENNEQDLAIQDDDLLLSYIPVCGISSDDSSRKVY